MARQKGIIKLKGTIGDITFYKTAQDGHLAREKGGIDGNRIASDPAFQRTRENGAEFGRAGKAGKLLRTAFNALLIQASDGRVASRLTRDMVKVLQADTVHARGMRTVEGGDPTLLSGFEFNIRGKLGSTLYAAFTATADRAAGTLTFGLPALVPVNMVAAPQGTTHFKVFSGGGELDFAGDTYTTEIVESAVLPWDSTTTAALTQTSHVTAASTLPLLLVAGIAFYQEVNGDMYPLNNGAYNPLSLVLVSTP